MEAHEKMEQMSEFLNDEFVKYINKKGRYTSMSVWARYIGVSNTSMSQWMNAHRLPTGKNAHKLADKLGPKVYDILEMPRLMPRDENLNKVVDFYMGMTDEARDLYLRIGSKMIEDGGVTERLEEVLTEE